MYIRILLLLFGMIWLTGCATSSRFEPSESDKLTEEEMQVMVKYARYFMVSQNKTLKFTPDELEIIQQTRPRIRVFYTAHKSGSLSIGWEMPTKQAFAVASGEMMTTRNWRVSVVRKSQVSFIKKSNPNAPAAPLSTKDFEGLLEKNDR